MAKIKNSINLTDHMSPVLRAINKSMNSTLKAMQSLDRQANRGAQSKAFQQAAKDVERANNALKRMQNNLDRTATSASRVSTNMSRIHSGGFNLVNLSAALYILENIKNVLGGMMEAPDIARATQARLGLFNESPYDTKQLYSMVYGTALQTRTGIEETGNLATRIMISGAMEGPDAALGAIKATGIINKALIAGGGTAEENRRALLQLSQGLASGVLQGDELRSLREQTPYLVSKLAEGLGKIDPKFADVSIGQMKKLGADGELTADRILKAFFAMEDEISKDFEKMPRTFGQAMTQMGTSWKYFLYLLSVGDGALAKINEKAWQIADFLSSDSGKTFLRDTAMLLTAVVDITIWAMEKIADAASFLRKHTDILAAGFVALGVVAVGAAISAFVAWVAAAWPILLVFALIGMLTYAWIQMGGTAGQVIGFLIGILAALGSVIWNLLQFIFSVVYAVIADIWNMGVGLYGAIHGFVAAVENDFNVMASGVLLVLSTIAGAVDKLFGSNLQSGINKGLASITSKIKTKAQIDAEVKGINSKKLDEFLKMDYTNPLAAYKGGVAIGDKFDKYTKNFSFDMGLDQVDNVMKTLGLFDPNNVDMTVKGGDLDSVGKIKSDVNINDEDLKLLRDMAAREFLVNLQTITPTANIQFGDVRETADVSKIMSAIEDMVEEALATTLVTS